jgi:RNA polymerase sigma-70 factor (ECF subfamily)|nr:sigma-70 family RNA polymerase sigma factor [Kofleriaceae bacterium]
MDDHDVLRQVLADDARAWSELLRRYRPLIYRCVMKVIARSHAHGVADADEVYAEVLLQLVRDDKKKLRAYDPARGTKLGSWLCMIALNAAYDYLRGAARRPRLDRDDAVVDVRDERAPSALDNVLATERAEQLDELLGGLTERDRAFVELYYRRELEPRQIASAMGISLKTVYSKKHKIREQLTRLAA